MSSTYKQILNFIDIVKEGDIFSIQDIGIKSTPTLIYNALSRLCKEEKIKRLSQGKYYVPRKTKFGDIKPSDEKIIEYVIDEIYKRTKSKPYFASNSVFQKLGLTTQISSDIFLICSIKVPYDISIKNLKFTLIRHNGRWNSKDIKYYEILYCIRNMHKVPDTTLDEVYMKLCYIISKFTMKEIFFLVKCSYDFNSKTKVLLGSIFSILGYNIPAKSLKSRVKDNYNVKINFELNNIPKDIKKYWRIYDFTSR